jgi:AraC family transcriptional regulator
LGQIVFIRPEDAMKTTFDTLRDYHVNDPSLMVTRHEMPHLAITRLHETSNDITIASVDRNFLSMDLSGTARHLTRMEGCASDQPTRPGDVAQVPAGMTVRYAWDTIGPRQTCLVVEFDLGLFELFAPEVDSNAFRDGHLLPRDYAQMPRLAGLMQLIAGELDPEWRRGRVFAEQVARLLALELAAASWSCPVVAEVPQPGPDRRVRRAIDFIESAYQGDISLLDIARESGLSATQLTQLFQRHTGRTPYAYVVATRLRHASEMLRTTRMPIAEVALDAGFADQQHMTRMFRLRLGTTPNAMRRNGS